MKIAIIGSRTFNDYELVCKTIKELKLETMTHMVSGGAKGADSLGERYAKEHNIPCIIYKPDWNTFRQFLQALFFAQVLFSLDNQIRWLFSSPDTHASLTGRGFQSSFYYGRSPQWL